MKRSVAALLVAAICAGALGASAQAAENGKLCACSVEKFADAQAITNTHAVAVTAGMGLFAGNTAEEFEPEGQVTRAQMAAIIVKMLQGSQFNADSYKGRENPFTDTADFEGGWAEGYISACRAMGIVAGYGDGTFRPGQPVNTAEALTMLVNALKVDAGAGQWPDTVTAKAQELGLYGELTPCPDTYDTLVRDQLAVLVYEGVCCAPGQAPAYHTKDTGTVYNTLEQAAGKDGVQDVWRAVDEASLAARVYGLNAIHFGHEWDDGTVTTPATTTRTGVRTFACTACTQTRTETIPKLSGGSGGGFGGSGGSSGGGSGGVIVHTHSWGEWTMTDEQEHTRICTGNAAHTQTQPHQWDEGTVSVPATYIEPGCRIYVCSVCGGTKTEEIPMLERDDTPIAGPNGMPIV